jgi:glucan biosynthesis protein C
VSKPNGRIFGLDAARSVLMLLGIVVHTGSFVASFQTASESPLDNSVLVTAILVHNFRMPAFFAVAGLFAAMLIDHRGLRGFWQQRMRRLLWPLIAASVTVIPITLALAFDVSTPQKLIDAGFMHMWFVYYLLIFSAVTILVYWLLHKVGLGQQKHEALKQFARRWFANPIVLLLAAVITYLLPAYFSNESGALEKDSSLLPNIYLLIFYGIFFSLGLFSYSIWQTIEKQLQKMWWLYLLIGGFAFVIYTTLVFSSSGESWWKFTYTISTWMLAAGFIAFFVRFANKPNRFFAYFSEASYWIYIVHLPIVIASLFWLTKWQVEFFWSFLISTAFTFGISTLSYHWLVKDTIIGKFLAGKIGQNLSKKQMRKKLSGNKKVRR